MKKRNRPPSCGTYHLESYIRAKILYGCAVFSLVESGEYPVGWIKVVCDSEAQKLKRKIVYYE